jgi:predicted HicB family RNase H-like nuclease
VSTAGPKGWEAVTYKGYQSRVELDEEAGVLHGEVIHTRDVITFQGTSVEELKQAFEDSVDDYLEFCASRGEDPAAGAACTESCLETS